jgi:uncharacterized membrane protein HdeD (DUF308 family)
MSAALHINDAASGTSLRVVPQRIAAVRAVLALVWAAVLVLAIGDDVPTTHTDLPTAAALLLASYPLIDVIASLLGSTFADARVLRINAAVSALAVVWIAIAAFGSDAGATLVAFGAWAAVSGAIQLGIAIHRRRAEGRQLPMIVSGAVSTIAGLSFIATSGDDKAHLATLAGYMAVGALLILIWARRSQADPQEAR